MILTHGANSLERGDFVEIGGRKYPVVKIGNQLWMAENLDWKFDGCEVGAEGQPTTPAAWYYNNNESDYGIDGTYKCGLLYNWYAVDYLAEHLSDLGVPAGWRLPNHNQADASQDDYRILMSSVGSEISKLKASDNSIVQGFPSGWNGNGESGFNMLPCGQRYAYGYMNINYDVHHWYRNGNMSWNAWTFDMTRTSFSYGAEDRVNAHPLRLVKDAT